ncbi:outer membrane lipoprotein [Rugamonas aquatica]|uniref:Glycine zipper 2TM domain-containing protein n=1 Tax=Rugamonas aquatica TaxID=2743357 RepID=A0A6A7NBH2_9BURK|nr:glycine zipper 2TM domain-containing protein [Rugamonas aquatica]MQA42520.1 glycine zipper 2TM domain-containing protein [Rugamonas aquatica]
MKHMTAIAAVLVAGTAVLSGCASTSSAPQQQGYYANQAEAASYGTIDAIQVVQTKSGSSGAGAVTGGLVGALLGNQIGSGSGRTAATVAGAVGGAVVGNNVENNRNQPHDQYQISVRMDNGDYRIVTQDNIYDLRTGNRVRLVDGRVYRY